MSEERKSKQLWVIHDYTIQRIVGYECPPNDDYWWFPSIGYSISLGYGCYEEYEEARVAALKKFKNDYRELLEEVDRVSKRIKELGGDLDYV